MQFLRNQLPDFKNSWNCLILTLLRIEQCTMYPPHLRLLPVQNSVKTVYLKTCSKCPALAFTQARSFLTMFSVALLIEFCGRSSWTAFWQASDRLCLILHSDFARTQMFVRHSCSFSIYMTCIYGFSPIFAVGTPMN